MSRVAYLINQYPNACHSFIRREVQALEATGVTVDRYSIRSTAGAFVDPNDDEEAQQTTVLLKNLGHLVWSAIRTATSSPLRFLAAARQTISYAIESDRGWVNHIAYLAEACMLKRLISARRDRHLHAHFGTNSAIVAALTHTLGGPRFSFTVHGPEEFERAVSLRLSATIRASEFVVAISEYGRNQLCRLVDCSQWGKISVVHCGLDRGLLNREQTPIPLDPRLVCVARLSEQKGHIVLLNALAELHRRGIACQLVLAGDGPLRSSIEYTVEQLGLVDFVRIAGWITEKQVVEELSAARALVLPSLAEGLPVVIMEAMALGRPVISTYVAGIPELVIPGSTGWLVPAGAVCPLVDAMVEVLRATPASLAEMGRRGQRAVKELHDVEVSAGQLNSLFQSEGPQV